MLMKMCMNACPCVWFYAWYVSKFMFWLFDLSCHDIFLVLFILFGHEHLELGCWTLINWSPWVSPWLFNDDVIDMFRIGCFLLYAWFDSVIYDLGLIGYFIDIWFEFVSFYVMIWDIWLVCFNLFNCMIRNLGFC